MNETNTSTARIFAAAIIPPAIGTALVYLGAVVLGEYGWTLFVFLPVLLGFSSTVIYSPRGERRYLKCLGVSLLSLVTIGVMIMAVAIEGLICLIMALPIAVPLMALGSVSGLQITKNWSRTGSGLAAFLFLTMPFLMGLEYSEKSISNVHKVTTTVEIDAPIEKVWANVVAFPQIEEEPQGILKLGFAYPINARIDGKGVGAIRYCNFDTGPFVEPITVWDAPHLLAFDVIKQPAPMTEMTPYSELHAAHLQYIRSQKGQFRLFMKDGKTIVEGTTFYTHDIAPDIYWKIFSDEIIHKIHLRVLNHIKNVSENAT